MTLCVLLASTLPHAAHTTRRSHMPQNARAMATAYRGSQDTLVPPVIPSSHPSQVCENTVSHQTSLKHVMSQSNTNLNDPPHFALLVSCHLTITITPFALLYDNSRLFYTWLPYILCTTGRSRHLRVAFYRLYII